MGLKERLKLVLDSTGLKLSEFSRESGIPYQSLQNYLRGERQPTLDNLIKISSQMNINLNWLLTGEGEMFRQEGGPPVKVEPGSVLEKILLVLKDMDEEAQRDILKHIEEKKLLMELLEERRKKKAG